MMSFPAECARLCASCLKNRDAARRPATAFPGKMLKESEGFSKNSLQTRLRSATKRPLSRLLPIVLDRRKRVSTVKPTPRTPACASPFLRSSRGSVADRHAEPSFRQPVIQAAPAASVSSVARAPKTQPPVVALSPETVKFAKFTLPKRLRRRVRRIEAAGHSAASASVTVIPQTNLSQRAPLECSPPTSTPKRNARLFPRQSGWRRRLRSLGAGA